MFRAIHRPSSGAKNSNCSLWFYTRFWLPAAAMAQPNIACIFRAETFTVTTVQTADIARLFLCEVRLFSCEHSGSKFTGKVGKWLPNSRCHTNNSSFHTSNLALLTKSLIQTVLTATSSLWLYMNVTGCHLYPFSQDIIIKKHVADSGLYTTSFWNSVWWQ